MPAKLLSLFLLILITRRFLMRPSGTLRRLFNEMLTERTRLTFMGSYWSPIEALLM